DKKIELGATHYISTSYDEEAKMLEEKYFTIEKSPQYILIDLTKDKNSKP
ncbi:MAG: 2 protein, partial [Patescibacteria group bacterium]|nr:2 protein [Patescibacteria group bacterium]